MIKRHLSLLLAISALLAGAMTASVAADNNTPAAPNATPPPAEAAKSDVVAVDPLYEIQPEDALQVDVWGEPTLQRIQLQVTPDGYINVAYIGDVKASGLKAQDLANAIGQKLIDADILRSPKVQVTVLSVHKLKVSVLGQVNRPGQVEIKDGDTVLEAIAVAGSYTPDAYLEGATITHSGNETEPLNLKALLHNGDLSHNMKLKKGDTIYIPEDNTNKFFVLGEVLRPGQYQLRDNTTILSAISQAGGPTPRGTLKSTVLIRGDLKSPERVPVDVAKLMGKADLTQNVDIKPGDVVYVPETSKPDWNKISQILNVISNVGFIRRYGLF